MRRCSDQVAESDAEVIAMHESKHINQNFKTFRKVYKNFHPVVYSHFFPHRFSEFRMFCVDNRDLHVFPFSFSKRIIPFGSLSKVAAGASTPSLAFLSG